MIGFVVLAGFGLTRAMAGARFANFGSNVGSLAIYALSGRIVVVAGLAMGAGAFLGARLGAHAALRAGRASCAAADRRCELRNGAAPDGGPGRPSGDGVEIGLRRLTPQKRRDYKPGDPGWAATRPVPFFERTLRGERSGAAFPGN